MQQTNQETFGSLSIPLAEDYPEFVPMRQQVQQELVQNATLNEQPFPSNYFDTNVQFQNTNIQRTQQQPQTYQGTHGSLSVPLAEFYPEYVPMRQQVQHQLVQNATSNCQPLPSYEIDINAQFQNTNMKRTQQQPQTNRGTFGSSSVSLADFYPDYVPMRQQVQHQFVQNATLSDQPLPSNYFDTNVQFQNTNMKRTQQKPHANRGKFGSSSVSLADFYPDYKPMRQQVQHQFVQNATMNNQPLPSDDYDVNIQVSNVVANFKLPFPIDLKKLALNTKNVVYNAEKGVLTKQRRNPMCLIKVFKSGKILITGCRGEVECKTAARSFSRHVQKVMGRSENRICMIDYNVNNIMASCQMPFGINIEKVAAEYPEASYEPELRSGLLWKWLTPKATAKVYRSGTITLFGAHSEADVGEVMTKIHSIVSKFQSDSSNNFAENYRKRRAPLAAKAPRVKRERIDKMKRQRVHPISSGVINNQVYFSDEENEFW